MRSCALHHADGEPIVHEVRQLAHTLCPNLLDEDLEHASLHTLLLCTYRIPLVRVRFTVRAVTLSPTIARLLNVPSGTPGFAVERITYRSATLPAVRMVQRWRGDRFAFSEEIIGLREPPCGTAPGGPKEGGEHMRQPRAHVTPWVEATPPTETHYGPVLPARACAPTGGATRPVTCTASTLTRTTK
ncbi:MAG: UTRA domain-containing protein [Ardenticatenia bacterium]|nr:UTRA domain-containing protein [Ardenticatenia bacterium]